MEPISAIEAAKAALRIYKSLGGWLEKRRKDRLAHWFWQVCTHPCWNAPPEIVQEEIRKALDDDANEDRRELIWSTAKELVDCVSDAALPAIASIAAERLQRALPIDHFYRGAVRLLADLSSQEVVHMRELLTLLFDCSQKGTLRVVFMPPDRLIVREGAGEKSGPTLHDSALPFSAVRLVALLKDHHLGYELVGVYGAAVVVDIESQAVGELLRHLGPVSPQT